MATAKKPQTNYVSYEIEKLDKYIKQLQNFLDKNPPDKANDRLHIEKSTRGNPIIKVVSKKEDQVKAFKDTLMQLPRLIADLNKLKREVSGQEEKGEAVGGKDVPGFMDDDDIVDNNIDNAEYEKQDNFEDVIDDFNEEESNPGDDDFMTEEEFEDDE